MGKNLYGEPIAIIMKTTALENTLIRDSKSTKISPAISPDTIRRLNIPEKKMPARQQSSDSKKQPRVTCAGFRTFATATTITEA
jgi:hypothetical protein